MTILDEVEILHIFRPTMESFEGQGDSIQSPDNERGDDVQTTGEHDQDPGPGPPSSGASEGLVPEESDSRDQQPWGQSRGDENRGWMQREWLLFASGEGGEDGLPCPAIF